jgi:N-acetylmuramoyl-L-alanine amidase
MPADMSNMSGMRWLAGLLAAVLLGGCATGWRRGPAAAAEPGDQVIPAIVDRPIPFGRKRQALTLDYIRSHYDPAASSITIEPRMVVIHWTASPDALATLAAFRPATLPPSREEIRRGGKLNVSSHFLVDRDGTIYRLMPETWMARHVIGLNRLALGIENAGGPDHPLTAAQLRANAALVRHLVAKHPRVEYLIGHHEYGSFHGTPLWQERDPSYFTQKQDPGAEFMQRLRAELADLGLAGAYRPPRPSG